MGSDCFIINTAAYGHKPFFFFFLMNEMKSTNSGVEHPQLHRDAVREVSA